MAHSLLLAMPSQAGTYFADTVTYLCRHDREGAFGIVLNQPMDLPFATLMEQAGIPRPAASATMPSVAVRGGGPVHPEQGVLLHSMDVSRDDTEALGHELGLTFSRDMLEAVVAGNGPASVLFALGYAGWGAGQLEAEIARDAWLVLQMPGTPDARREALHHTLFDTPASEVLAAVSAQAGADLRLLSGHIGHA
ncbi:MAG: YqgE/AlgH family protein [Pseudomonadota bacterium]